MMSDLFLCAQPAAQAAYPCETHTWAKMAGTEMARGIDFGHQGQLVHLVLEWRWQCTEGCVIGEWDYLFSRRFKYVPLFEDICINFSSQTLPWRPYA